MEFYICAISILFMVADAFPGAGFLPKKDTWSGAPPFQQELGLAMKAAVPATDTETDESSYAEFEAFVLALAMEQYLDENYGHFELVGVEECVCDAQDKTCLVTAEYADITCAREGQDCQDWSVQTRINCRGLYEIDSLELLNKPSCDDVEDENFDFEPHGLGQKFLVPHPSKSKSSGDKKWGSSSGHIHPLSEKKWGSTSGSMHPLSVRNWKSTTGGIHPLSQRDWDPCTGGVHALAGRSGLPCREEQKRIMEELDDEEEPDF